MKSRKKIDKQPRLGEQDLEWMLDQRQPLYRLAKEIDWEVFEREFGSLYSEMGRPAKAIRLMVGLTLLKYIENLSDEIVVERWVQNPYYQYFCGERFFQWSMPCDPTDFVYFRKRIGEVGAQKILKASLDLHAEQISEEEVVADTTVQEKNITFPTDTKLRVKVIERLWKMADESGVQYYHSYKQTVPRLLARLRTRSNRLVSERRKARKRLKTLAGRLLREYQRKASSGWRLIYAEELELMERVLEQSRYSKNKVYSLHEPKVNCIAKGKVARPYEFGNKVSVVTTRDSNVIVGAMSFKDNLYDGDTLPEVLWQVEHLTGKRPKSCLVDRGYRGNIWVGSTRIDLPTPARKNDSAYLRKKHRKRMARRAAIEPIIGHLKMHFRVGRNYLSGLVGDSMNIQLACAAYNYRKWMREASFLLKMLIERLGISNPSSFMIVASAPI